MLNPNKINKGITITVIFEADACNYGEGIGNVTPLKKKPINGEMYTYVSRNAIKYSLYNMIGWDDTPVVAQGGGEKTVVQYDPSVTIETSPEIDLRGYMRTDVGSSADTRSAVLRVSDAVSLEPYRGTLDFIQNMGMSKRLREKASNNLANVEVHHSQFVNTYVADLDRIGVDGDINLSNEEKKRRMLEAITGIEFLYRECKGVTENLCPIFVIGGVYDRKNPFFLNRVKLKDGSLNTALLKETIANAGIENETIIGSMSDMFKNCDEVAEFAPKSIREAFDELRKAVEEVYK